MKNIFFLLGLLGCWVPDTYERKTNKSRSALHGGAGDYHYLGAIIRSLAHGKDTAEGGNSAYDDDDDYASLEQQSTSSSPANPNDQQVTKPQSKHDSESGKEVCKTAECSKAAKQILQSMDLTVDPCTDFYKFACGGFIRDKEIPKNAAKLEMLTPMNKQLMTQGRMLLDAGFEQFVGETESDWAVFKKARDHYQACMNEDARSKSGITPTLKVLELIGGWPVLEKQRGDNGSYLPWYKMEEKLVHSGVTAGHILSLGIVIDSRNATRHVLRINPPKLGLPNKFLLEGVDNKMVKAYFGKMMSVALLFGADKEKAKQDMSEALEFEMDLAEKQVEVNDIEKKREKEEATDSVSKAEASQPDGDRKKSSKEYPQKLSALRSGPGLPSDWVAFVSVMLLGRVNVTSDFEVTVLKPSFLTALNQLLSNTSPRTVANYFCWRIIDLMLPHMHQEARSIVSEFNSKTKGKKSLPPAWHRCTHILGFNNYNAHSISIATAAMYVQKLVDDQEKKIMQQIIETIRESFERVIEELDWMDEETRKLGLKKLSEMKKNVVYPDPIANRTLVEEYLKDLKVSNDDYFRNVLEMQYFDDIKCVEKLFEDPEKSSWKKASFVIVVNAFYQPKTNRMSFPAAFLQDYMFNSKLPLYINYGGVGAIVGHEITHGFDDNGRKFDHTGSKKNWWYPTTLKRFLNKTTCIKQQYDNYYVEKVQMNVNGKLTLGENIADNGGMKINHLGYDLAIERNKHRDPALPGMEQFTPQQMFWINHAHTFCSKIRPPVLERKMKNSVHSPMEFRINGVAVNSKLFAKDFQCKEGTKMNPEKKCIIW